MPAHEPTSWAPEVAETHSAWVVMLGDRAYKVKKSVRLDFLDFSTREARERALHRELELNRRMAPDVYLGVADVLGPAGDPCEHVLIMRRMPADSRLSTLVVEHAPLGEAMREIARAVATFHARAERSPTIAAAGAPEAVRAKLARDLRELGEYAGDVLDTAVLARAGSLARRYVAGRTALFEDRIARGLVVDGHGDLLAGDIFCLDDGPRILDCIEFDDRLRCCDVLADVAFLAMDLERLGAPELATLLIGAYQEFSAERHPQTLADYYIATRALVRAKVACIRAAQDGGSSVDDARIHLDLAVEHLRRAQVRLVLVGGEPGTGKTTLAGGLATRLGFAMLRSDEVRKDVVGLPHTQRADGAYGTGIYDSATTVATYGALLDRARDALALGESVVLDASWSDASRRAAAVRLAEDAAADVHELRCDAPVELAAARIADRRSRGSDASDATPEVAEAMRSVFDPWPSARVISTAGTEERSLADALLALDAGA